MTDITSVDDAVTRPEGSTVPGVDPYADRRRTLEFDAPMLAMAAAPGLQPGWRQLADHLEQPSSSAASAPAVQFYLVTNQAAGPVYQGRLYYRAALPPFGYFSRNRFYGVGYLIPNNWWGELYKTVGSVSPQLPPPWVRIVVAARTTSALAGLTFHASDATGALPGTEVGWAEEDATDPSIGGSYAASRIGGWDINMVRTTALLGA
jgi:hypothetical protein